MIWLILAITAGEISGIIAGVFAGIVAVIGAVGKIINDKRRENGNHTCCITGRPLKPKKPKENNAEDDEISAKVKEIEEQSNGYNEG